MARVEKLTEREPLRVSVHGEVEASFHIFESDGETFLQIDSYGAPDRKIPAKVSQSIQLGAAGRRELLKLLLKLDT
jgi:hypothetical protein